VSSEPVNIRVLDREYTIGVDPDARDSLVAAAIRLSRPSDSTPMVYSRSRMRMLTGSLLTCAAPAT
jgi:hypothetical protein